MWVTECEWCRTSGKGGSKEEWVVGVGWSYWGKVAAGVFGYDAAKGGQQDSAKLPVARAPLLQ